MNNINNMNNASNNKTSKVEAEVQSTLRAFDGCEQARVDGLFAARLQSALTRRTESACTLSSHSLKASSGAANGFGAFVGVVTVVLLLAVNVSSLYMFWAKYVGARTPNSSQVSTNVAVSEYARKVELFALSSAYLLTAHEEQYSGTY